MSTRKRKFWGWGYEGEGPTDAETREMAARVAARLGVKELAITPPPTLDEISLRPPRIQPPASLAALCSTDKYDRVAHSYGRGFRDLARIFRRDFPNPPDVVAFPKDEADVVRILDWCQAGDLAAIPYGGGSSVVGGIEPPEDDVRAGAVTIDLCHLNRVLEVDKVSRAARIQAGVLGPALEDQLRPHGFSLRHQPQSWEFSSLGGWIATRSSGHFATLYNHIDDFVEALRVVTPTGVVETRRLPGSGAGPSPDRLFIGSEGILGIITEAWMRLQTRPTVRADAAVPFPDFYSGVEAVRAISQAALFPQNCRILDEVDAAYYQAGNGTDSVLMLTFDSFDHSVDPWMKRALEICADHGGRVTPEMGKTRAVGEKPSGDALANWRHNFRYLPHMAHTRIAMGVVSSTFETAITWERFVDFDRELMRVVHDETKRLCGGGGASRRLSFVYPDGAAPYYSVLAPSRADRQLEDWDTISAEICDAIIRLGGTITHHHAVGRHFRPWYDRQRPEPFARALRAAKRELDPKAVLNPGVLIDPLR